MISNRSGLTSRRYRHCALGLQRFAGLRDIKTLQNSTHFELNLKSVLLKENYQMMVEKFKDTMRKTLTHTKIT